jgi:hypothetical protein
MHASGFLTTSSQAPKVSTLRGVQGGIREVAYLGPHDMHGAHTTSSTHTHLTRVQLRELLCFGSSALKSWDPMVVET